MLSSKYSHRDNKTALRKIARTSFLTSGLRNFLFGFQRSSDCSRLLRAQVKGRVLLAFGGGSRVRLLLLVVNRENAGNGLAHDLDFCQLRSRSTSNLRNSQLR